MNRADEYARARATKKRKNDPTPAGEYFFPKRALERSALPPVPLSLSLALVRSSLSFFGDWLALSFVSYSPHPPPLLFQARRRAIQTAVADYSAIEA